MTYVPSTAETLSAPGYLVLETKHRGVLEIESTAAELVVAAYIFRKCRYLIEVSISDIKLTSWPDPE